jgi:Zn-dependent hydrolases, including glyoxylases
MFEINRANEHIYHIRDKMGVCVTLLVGRERALLFDTGYGLFNLPACIRQMTDLPLQVILSHGHHDHALGYSQFETVYLHEKERPCFDYYTRGEQKQRVLAAALNKGLAPEENLPAFETEILSIKESAINLGGITAQVHHLPGHTPGSLGIIAGDMLLIADNWNPTTWVFFPECAKMADYQRMMEGLSKLPFKNVLASHCFEAVSAKRVHAYIEGLKKWGGEPVNIAPYESINTYACHPEIETTLVYDRNKL